MVSAGASATRKIVPSVTSTSRMTSATIITFLREYLSANEEANGDSTASDVSLTTPNTPTAVAPPSW